MSQASGPAVEGARLARVSSMSWAWVEEVGRAEEGEVGEVEEEGRVRNLEVGRSVLSR